MTKFVKKPVEIEAWKYNFPASNFLKSWLGAHMGREMIGELEIKTLEDGSNHQVKHIASDGDWIIQGIKGEYYPCKSDIFHETYEEVK